MEKIAKTIYPHVANKGTKFLKELGFSPKLNFINYPGEKHTPLFHLPNHTVKPTMPSSSAPSDSIYGRLTSAIKDWEANLNPKVKKFLKHQKLDINLPKRDDTFLTLGRVGTDFSGSPTYGLKLTRKF